MFGFRDLSGGFFLHDSVLEGPSINDKGDFFVAVESSPFLGSRLSKFEHHRQTCSPGSVAFGLEVVESNRCERGFDGIGCS